MDYAKMLWKNSIPLKEKLFTWLVMRDRYQSPFVQQTLKMKGFSEKWCEWVHNFISGGSVAIKVNDNIGHYFKTKKGLR